MRTGQYVKRVANKQIYTNEVIPNERTHLHILGTYIKKIKEKNSEIVNEKK